MLLLLASNSSVETASGFWFHSSHPYIHIDKQSDIWICTYYYTHSMVDKSGAPDLQTIDIHSYKITGHKKLIYYLFILLYF